MSGFFFSNLVMVIAVRSKLDNYLGEIPGTATENGLAAVMILTKVTVI